MIAITAAAIVTLAALVLVAAVGICLLGRWLDRRSEADELAHHDHDPGAYLPGPPCGHNHHD